MKKYLSEFIGTFFLVLTVVLTANNPGVGNFAPLATGAMLTVMVFAGSHLSGAYYNPALTLSMLLRGEIDRHDATYYALTQLVAGFFAALIGVYLLGCQGITDINARSNQAACAVVGELLGTFALAYVALNVATTRTNEGNSFYGLAIGFAMMSAMYGFGGLSGGAFNPAIALGMAVASMVSWGDLWIYLLGPLLGAAAAASAFQVLYGREE